MASCPITSSWQTDGETMETVTDFIFFGFKITADGDCSHEIKRCFLEEKLWQTWTAYSKAKTLLCWQRSIESKHGFSSGRVWMRELDYKERWLPKNWSFRTVLLEKTLESPLDCKEIPPVCPKGNQSWIFIGRTDAEAETPILWPPDGKIWLI